MVYRFSEFELDADRYELRRDGVAIDLQPKVMAVLLHLVQNADRTCTKDELIDAVWGDVNVSEGSLVRCIAVARRALGESEAHARIVQTVRGRGYRIAVEVEEPTGPRPTSTEVPTAKPSSQRLWLWAGLVTLLVLCFAWLARPFADLPEPRQRRFGGQFPATSVAVLPSVAPGSGPESRAVAESVALQSIDRLGAVAELEVVSFASSSGVVESGPPMPREIGERLSVGTLVFERVHHRNDTLRIGVEVVDASSGFQRWSRSYERPADLSDELARLVAEEVARVLGTLVEAGPGYVAKTGKVRALDYYLQGREATHAANRERLLEAVARYERAIELDPAYLDAYIALADAYERLWDQDPRGAGWLDRGEIAILKARELAPLNAQAIATHANLMKARRQWKEAEAALRRALELRPSARIYNLYAQLLCMLGRSPEAVPLVARALELNPHDPEIQRAAGRVHHYVGNHELAVAHLWYALELDPRAVYTPRLLAGALLSNGQEDEAREVFLLLTPRFIRPLARVYDRLFGRAANLRLLLRLDIARTGKACRGDGHGTAIAWALLGERESMLECLAEDVDRHLYYVVEDPVFDPYRDDPRFQAILSEAGFPSEGG